MGNNRAGGNGVEPADAIPPQSLDMELAVIGACLIDPVHVIPEVRHIAHASMFYRAGYADIYRTLLAMHAAQKPIDVLSAQDALAAAGKLESAGGHVTLLAAMQACAACSNATYYAQQVRAAAGRRFILAALSDAMPAIYDMDADPSLIASRLSAKLAQAIDGLSTEQRAYPIRALMGDVMDYVETRISQGKPDGIELGFPTLDRLTGGLAPGSLVFLGARPSVGKSAFAMHAAIHAARSGHRVVVFSYEMDVRELCLRTVCGMAGISMGRARAGSLDITDCAALGEPTAMLAELPLTIVDATGLTVHQIEVQLRRANAEFAVVDYLQLIPPVTSHRNDRQREVAELSMQMKGIARTLRIPLLVLSQLNRASESREDREPQLSDMRESGAQEQDADIVVMMWRPQRRSEGEAVYPLAGMIAKNRNGPLGRWTWSFTPSRMHFGE